MKVLQSALARHPYDREILFALATYDRAAGDVAGARSRAKLLRELEPENRDFARLAAELGSSAATPR
jgi:Flp pilus assembly protein TadD